MKEILIVGKEEMVEINLILTFNSFSRFLPKQLRSHKYRFAKSQHRLNPNRAGMDLQ